MDYFKMYKDIWELHKKYIDKVDSRDDEIWKSIIVEADELTKKYDNCKFIKNLVMAENLRGCIMSGQSKEYREYMKSDSWERKKRERLKIDGYKCTACGYSAKPNVLMVHHLTYARLGNEDTWKDLVTLCPICHRKIHNMLRRRQAPE